MTKLLQFVKSVVFDRRRDVVDAPTVKNLGISVDPIENHRR